jgi:hypothetical protein
LLFVVLAIAVRVAPENLAGDARSRRLTSLRYYWSCMSILSSPHRHCSIPMALTARRSMLIAAAIQPDSLDMVLTRLLASGLVCVIELKHVDITIECTLSDFRSPNN